MTVEDSLAGSFVVVAGGAPKNVVQEIFKTQVVFFFFFLSSRSTGHEFSLQFLVA